MLWLLDPWIKEANFLFASLFFRSSPFPTLICLLVSEGKISFLLLWNIALAPKRIQVFTPTRKTGQKCQMKLKQLCCWIFFIWRDFGGQTKNSFLYSPSYAVAFYLQERDSPRSPANVQCIEQPQKGYELPEAAITMQDPQRIHQPGAAFFLMMQYVKL